MLPELEPLPSSPPGVAPGSLWSLVVLGSLPLLSLPLEFGSLGSEPPWLFTSPLGLTLRSLLELVHDAQLSVGIWLTSWFDSDALAAGGVDDAWGVLEGVGVV